MEPTTAMECLAPAPLTGLNPNFAFDEDGMPVYTGTTEQDISDDWDSVSESVTTNLWELAAIASTVVTVYGEGNINVFAHEHRTSSSWIRKLARTYRAFQNGMRIPMLSFYHHLEASLAKNPGKAAKIAHDREYSTRDLKRWIYMGEGRGRGMAKELSAAPSANDKPIEVTAEPDPDDEEGVTIEDEVLGDEDRHLLTADLELGLRICAYAIEKSQTSYVLRCWLNLQQELDWEVQLLTKASGKLPERIEMLIRGGCWISSEIMKRAKVSNEKEFNRICRGLEKDGKIKWSREGKRKHGTAPEMWMPADMPDGPAFDIDKEPSAYDSGGEEHY